MATLRRGFRVALFSGNYDVTRDGSNQALKRLVEHLAVVCGCEVRVYSPTVGPAHPLRFGALVSVPSIAIPTRPEYRLATGLPREIREDLVRFAPDIVHLSAPDLTAWRALGLARAMGVPVVASVHTRFETYLRYYGLGWLRPLAELYLHAFYGRCDYVLAPSRIMAKAVFPTGRGRRLRIWSRGVDGGLFDPRRRDEPWRRAHGFADDDVVVLFFGRLVKEKGLAVFAEAVGRAQVREPRVRALVVGSGPAQSWLQRRLPGAVFTGMLSGEALGAAVASADLLLNPSLTETFGNVTLEAMSAGLPVVCADAPAHRALVSGETGLFCPGQDAAAFARTILELAADPARRRALGAAARRESARYSWPEVLDSVVSVYAEAAAAPSPSPIARIDPAQSFRRQDAHRLASTRERRP